VPKDKTRENSQQLLCRYCEGEKTSTRLPLERRTWASSLGQFIAEEVINRSESEGSRRQADRSGQELKRVGKSLGLQAIVRGSITALGIRSNQRRA
jgi:hypothetical protein